MRLRPTTPVRRPVQPRPRRGPKTSEPSRRLEMSKTFTKRVTSVALVALAFLTAACGGGSNTTSTTSDKGPIKIWTMEDSKSFTALMGDFTQQTGIPVQVEAVPWGNVNDKLTTPVASGNGPDVMQIGLSLFPTFESANALLHLSPYLTHHPRPPT